MNNNKYTQEELKQFFNHQMNENEQQKIKELDADDMISKIKKQRIVPYQIKYIEKIGYVFIGRGFIIVQDKSGSRHEEEEYFTKIIKNKDDAKKEIVLESNK